MVLQFQIRFLDLTRSAFHLYSQRSLSSLYIRKMSISAAASKLRAPVHDLVLSVTQDGQEFVAQTEADEKEIVSWIEKTASGSFVNENNLKVCAFIRT